MFTLTSKSAHLGDVLIAYHDTVDNFKESLIEATYGPNDANPIASIILKRRLEIESAFNVMRSLDIKTTIPTEVFDDRLTKAEAIRMVRELYLSKADSIGKDDSFLSTLEKLFE